MKNSRVRVVSRTRPVWPYPTSAGGLVRIHHFNHRARRRRIIDDRVVVFRLARLVHGQPHQRVAVRGREIDAVEQFLHGEAVELRRHLGAAAEHAA